MACSPIWPHWPMCLQWLVNQLWPWWPDVHLSGDVVGLGGLAYISCFGDHVWPRLPFCSFGLPWCSLKVLRYLYIAAS